MPFARSACQQVAVLIAMTGLPSHSSAAAAKRIIAEVKRYFGDAGLTVVRDIALQCTSWTGIAAVTPIQCRDAIRRLDGTDVNAVVQVGTNLSLTNQHGVSTAMR
jgi:maleate cis-trans isomerase